MAKKEIPIRDVMKMAQIHKKDIDSKILNELFQRASFIDTDKSLNECIVSVEVFNNIAEEWEALDESNPKFKLVPKLEALNKQFGHDYNYIQIVTL